MANPDRGEVDLEAAGKRYVLRFSAGSMAHLEGHLKLPIREIIPQSAGGGPQLSWLRNMMWSALLDRLPDITIAQAGNVIETAGPDSAAVAIGQALELCLPPPSVETSPAAPPADWSALLIDWLVADYPEDLFWRLTLKEIDVHFRAARKRAERDSRQRRWDIWHIAVLQKQQKRFPSFEEFVEAAAATGAAGSLDERMRKTAAAMAARAGLH